MPAVMAPEAQFRQTQSLCILYEFLHLQFRRAAFSLVKKAKNKVYYEQRINT